MILGVGKKWQKLQQNHMKNTKWLQAQCAKVMIYIKCANQTALRAEICDMALLLLYIYLNDTLLAPTAYNGALVIILSRASANNRDVTTTTSF